MNIGSARLRGARYWVIVFDKFTILSKFALNFRCPDEAGDSFREV